MTLSINTNVGAMIALRHLNKTNSLLENTQLRITTGLKINGPKDDASTFAIAQNMRGDIAGMAAVRTALVTGESIVNTAVQGALAISDLLLEMKAKIVQANQDGLDTASRTALHNDFTALRAQIETIVASAEFNGTNLIQSGASNLSVLMTVAGSTITVSAQNMSPTGIGIQVSDISTSSAAVVALSAIETAITTVNSRLADLGTSAKRLELQSEFTTQLLDILKQGVGNLVDADMAAESASLTALQVRQQLGVQSLAIANASPQTILQLFQ
ncbi:MAG: flagellin [Alphaproteobacteria bacterium]|nr:flagellin [Alphaproteobacteria bacterium]